MKRIKQFTSRMLAVMLAGTLAVGSVSVSAFGAEDAGSTVAAAEEFSVEERTEEGVDEPSSSETVDGEVMTESSSAEVVDGKGVSESPDAAFVNTSETAAVEAAVISYTVTLDANGGYFANEMDDVLNETLEKTEVLNKIVPVGGTVPTIPLNDQEGTTATFLGWSLERDGEILPQEQEGYAPVGDCVLYAVWKYDDAVDPSVAIGEDVPEEVLNDPIKTEEPEASAPEEQVAQENDNEDALIDETTAEGNADEAPATYAVTLDANGGYFVNEWDDVLGEYVEHVEILNKVIPVEGVVSIVPVNEQDGITTTFLGWSLERDGEILPQEQEGYAPVGDCVLYAIWEVIESENAINNDEIDEDYEAVPAEEASFQDNKEENEEKIESIDEEAFAAVHETKGIGEYQNSEKTVSKESNKISLPKEKEGSSNGDTAEIAVEDDSTEEFVSEEAMGAATYTQSEYNGHMYQLFNEGVSWSTAKKRCEEKGGHLVTVTSSGEYSFCKSLLGDLSPKYCWMGATHASGTWKWITGETWGFTAWSPNQPNGSGGGTYALMQNFKGVGSAWNWDDQGNSGTSPSEMYRGSPYYHITKNYCYICEWENVAPKLNYLEVGINGDVNVHWKAPANTSFIKGYRVRHRIVGSTKWMTTDISGSTSSNVILRNLAVNDYEIKICSIMLSDGKEIESSYSKAVRCPVPKIEIINPVSGTMFADSYALNLIMGLGHEAKYTGKGGIRVYDSDNKIVFSKKLSGEEDGTRKLDVVCSTGYTWNDKKASDPQEILKPNNYYHVSIDEKSIQYIENEYETFQVPIYFSGIKKTEDTWKFKTVKQSYPGVINPNGHKINEQFYHLLFGDGWKDIYGEDDGSNGHCFGLSYVVGAYEYNFNNLKEVTTGYSKLSDVPINSQSKLMEYVMIAHLIQADSEYKASRYKENDKAYELYNAVKSGRNVLVNMNCSGGNHTIYTLGIIDDSDESNIQIAVYDSTFPTITFANNQYGSYRTFVPTLVLKKGLTKNNWKFEYKTNMHKDFTLSSFVEVDSKYDSRITDIATIAHNNSISKSTIANLVTKTYTGKGITQKPVVKFNSTILKINTDYTVSYKKNINAGIATLIITGKGYYAGKKTATFKINRASIGKASVSCPASKVWTGWALTPVPTVKVGAVTLKKGTDFSLAFTNNKNVGTATITITGKGNYTGTIKKTFKINPKPTSISKLSGGSRNYTIGWKKQPSQTSGYQIQYSSRSDFKTQKIVTVSGASKTSRTVSGLAKKHKYYVRIRTYKTVGKTKYYSTWSAAKTVTTK